MRFLAAVSAASRVKTMWPQCWESAGLRVIVRINIALTTVVIGHHLMKRRLFLCLTCVCLYVWDVKWMSGSSVCSCRVLPDCCLAGWHVSLHLLRQAPAIRDAEGSLVQGPPSHSRLKKGPPPLRLLTPPVAPLPLILFSLPPHLIMFSLLVLPPWQLSCNILQSSHSNCWWIPPAVARCHGTHFLPNSPQLIGNKEKCKARQLKECTANL